MCTLTYRTNKLLLAFINVFYLTIALALIIIASITYASPKVASIDIAVGLIVIGIALMALSCLGIFAAFSQNQAMLFFYSLLMLFTFVIQYALAIACLAAAHRNLVQIITVSWNKIDLNTKIHIMNRYKCCALDKNDWDKNSALYIENPDPNNKDIVADECLHRTKNTPAGSEEHPFFDCGMKIEETIDDLATWCGTVALVFCFFEMFGIWLAMRFRNAKDPFSDIAGRNMQGINRSRKSEL